ncbi:cation:dicarboxylase symporter family transporter, partial [Streptomyces sp. SID7982]|nr:cation:dicarboxylase symporter family transporter [Streptomyces sp. SID7982]
MSANPASTAPEAEQPTGSGSGSRPRIPKVPFWAQIVAGLVLGVLLGWLARSQDLGWLVTTLDEIGSLFVQLLKLAVAPLVFFAILVSITNLRQVNNAA